MAKDIIQLNAAALTGPRSFFTDLDPKDPTYDKQLVMLKLKLQLLTKEKIVIAASSLFTDTGYELLSNEQGFIDTLEQGIIVPALRNEFVDPKDFFQRYQHKNCSISSRNFFTQHVTHTVPWDLKENSSWFKDTFYDHLKDPNSLLRQKTSMTESMAQEFLGYLDSEIAKGHVNENYLRREHIFFIAKQFGEEICSYVSNYANLVYRISGSRVVNSESHFPQSNLTKLNVTEDDGIISDDSIFWDIYIETVVSFLNSAIRLTPARLNALSVYDILKIRKKLINIRFSEEYDNLIRKAKDDIDIHDPQKIILKQSEINAAARSLKDTFAARFLDELQIKDYSQHEQSLWQLANALALISMSSTIGLVFGILSRLKSIPEITSLTSKPQSEMIAQRYQWVRNFINCRIGWSKEQRKSLLDGYRELLTYGIPD